MATFPSAHASVDPGGVPIGMTRCFAVWHSDNDRLLTAKACDLIRVPCPIVIVRT